MRTTSKLCFLLANGSVVFGLAHAGDLEPPGPPASTMVTLQEIYDLVQSQGTVGAVAKTGQTECWDEFGTPINCAGTGQDGEYRAGVSVSPRFTNNGDGTAKDNLTGLIWLKNGNCFGGLTWTNALTASNTLAGGACGLTDGSAAGDWRLPNFEELQSLTFPVGHPFSPVASYYYWSSTTAHLHPAPSYTFRAYAVDPIANDLFAEDKTTTYYVWPVRGGTMAIGSAVFRSGLAGDLEPPGPPASTMVTLPQIYDLVQSQGTVGAVAKTGQTECWDVSGTPIDCAGTGQDGEYQAGVSVSPRFVNNGDGTVKDNLTGLIWLKNGNCFGFKNWGDALPDVNTLASGSCGLTDGSLAGDWRLPNFKELQSLTLPVGHPFSPVGSFYCWSSTTAPVPQMAWVVYPSINSIASFHKVASNAFVWPVRGGQ